jgi:hypothetical protein
MNILTYYVCFQPRSVRRRTSSPPSTAPLVAPFPSPLATATMPQSLVQSTEPFVLTTVSQFQGQNMFYFKKYHQNISKNTFFPIL